MEGGTSDPRPPASFSVSTTRSAQLCLADSYTWQINHNLDYCSNCLEYSIETPLDYVATLKNDALPTSISMTEEWVTSTAEPIDKINQFKTIFNTATPHNISLSSQSMQQTSSIRGDVPEQEAPQTVQPRTYSSTASFHAERVSGSSIATINGSTLQHTVPRSHGRSRTYCEGSSSSASPESLHKTRTRRLTHNQVEQKYRNSLNAGIERLRCAVPTLPQEELCVTLRQGRPSKLAVLASAVEYIKCIEQQRDAAVERLECLRDTRLSMIEGRVVAMNSECDGFLDEADVTCDVSAGMDESIDIPSNEENCAAHSSNRVAADFWGYDVPESIVLSNTRVQFQS